MTAGPVRHQQNTTCVKALGVRQTMLKCPGNSSYKSTQVAVSIVDLAKESFKDLSEDVVSRLKDKEQRIRQLNVQNVDVKALLTRIDRFLQPELLRKCENHPDPAQRAFLFKVAEKLSQLRPGVELLVSQAAARVSTKSHTESDC